MLSSQVRHRLRQLTVSHYAASRLPPCPGPAAQFTSEASDLQGAATSPIPIEKLRALGREMQTDRGAFWLIERPLVEVGCAIDERVARWTSRANQTESNQDPWSANFCRIFPDATLFFDLETCGLAGAAIFLVGIIRTSVRGLVLRQYWARNYAEEPAILTAFAEQLAGHELLVSFNGKCFDWPQVQDRCLMHGVPGLDAPTPRVMEQAWHWDLLYAARRRWKSRLPNCKLRTLEQWICQRRRIDDVPGHRIPEMYHAYVRSKNPELMAPILHHNALDLITLVDLAMRLSRPLEAPRCP